MLADSFSPTTQPIPGFPDYYVGDDGRLWSDARGRRRELKQANHSAGYRVVGLRRASERKRGGKVTVLFVHRLVLEAFVGPCPEGMECRHLDGTRTNNRLSNLAWGTSAENEADKVRHGTKVRGEAHSAAKLTESQVIQMRADVAAGMSCKGAAAKYGIFIENVRKIVRRKGWSHVA